MSSPQDTVKKDTLIMFEHAVKVSNIQDTLRSINVKWDKIEQKIKDKKPK